MFILTNRVVPNHEPGGIDDIHAIALNLDHVVAALPDPANERRAIIWLADDSPIILQLPFEQLRQKLEGLGLVER